LWTDERLLAPNKKARDLRHRGRLEYAAGAFYPGSLHSARDVSSRQHRQQARQQKQLDFERCASRVANQAICIPETIFVMAFIV
jgi:D-serine deaminase-like pyridoxal phosphate-dependent protein